MEEKSKMIPSIYLEAFHTEVKPAYTQGRGEKLN